MDSRGPDDTGAAPRSIVRGEPAWPPGLASIDVEPSRLWLRGRAELLACERKIAVVGSRAPTPYGVAQARRFGRELAAAGICVVSGLARGVDSAAHEGALEADGPTVAVLGCGVDRPWPAGPLADAMASRGLLISEFAPGTSPRKHHFPLRNRILAALSDAVLVVEAAHASGSLITARWAADQGQTVCAIPGRVDHPMAAGTLRLIREGASPVGSPAMLVEDVYGFEMLAEEREHAPSDDVTARILEVLRGETLAPEDVARRAELDLSDTLARLARLDLEGLVRRAPGGLYGIG